MHNISVLLKVITTFPYRLFNTLFMEFITKFFMICSPFVQADFTASAVLQAIRSEVPRLHGLRLAPAANSACEKSGLGVLKPRKKNPRIEINRSGDIPFLSYRSYGALFQPRMLRRMFRQVF
jgi:hypothetical protein